jgi:hypothetical protein
MAAQGRSRKIERYSLALFIFLAGVAGSAVLLYRTNSGAFAWGEALLRVTAPGEHDLTLPDAGRYTVFYEYEGVLGGRRYSTGETVPDFTLTLTTKETGKQVPFTATATGNYWGSTMAGKAVMDFTIDRPGEYRLTAAYPPEGAPREVLLAIGHDVSGYAVQSYAGLFGGGGLCCGSTVVALVIALLTLLQRPRPGGR